MFPLPLLSHSLTRKHMLLLMRENSISNFPELSDL